MYVRLVRLLMGLVSVVVAVLLGARGGPAAQPKTEEPAPVTDARRSDPLILEEDFESLILRRPRTEDQEDRIQALSLFAAGRMLERQGEYSQALRHYQRALRRDPQAVTVGRAVVSLAVVLKRYDQAARYALKLRPGNLEDANPRELRELGLHLTDRGDWDGAVKLYERALAARAGEKETAADIVLRMEMGRLYALVDQNDEAAESFARVLYALEHPKEFGLTQTLQKALLGEASATYNLFGDCFLRADRTDEAAAAFEKAHQVDPNKGLLAFNLARVHARRGKPAEALASLETCFKGRLSSEGMAPYELLAEVIEDLGRKEELTERLEKLHSDDPKNVPLGYSLAGNYLKTGKFEKAELLYVALLKKTPTLTGYRSLAEIYRKTDRPEPLLGILGEAAAKTATLETLGEQSQTILGDADLMQTLIETARQKLQSQPKKLDYGMCLAVALLGLESKQFETATEFFDLALKAEPKKAAELLPIWGIELLRAERPAEAAKVFRRLIDEKIAPDDNAEFHFYLAGALAVSEQTDEALAAARKAVELKEDSPLFHSRLAWILYRAERNDETIKAYVELIEQFDSDYESAAVREVLRETRFAISNLLVLKDDLTRAEEYLQQVLDEFPGDVGASNDLGYLWADQAKHLNRALKMIQAAVDAEPENVAFRDSLGWVLYRLGRYREAVAELEKAVAQMNEHDAAEGDAVILDHLGDAYLKLNQPQKAKHAWGRAVTIFQKQEEPEKAKQVQEKINGNK